MWKEAENDIKENWFQGEQCDMVKRRAISNPAEQNRSTTTNSTVPILSKGKASVHPRENDEVEPEVSGDLLQLVSFRKHATVTADVDKKRNAHSVCLGTLRFNGTNATCA